VVVYDLDINRIAILPNKTDTPLVVDTDTELTATISGQLFQPVGWRDAQVLQGQGPVEHSQLAQRNLLNISRQLARQLTSKYFFSFFVAKASDHDYSL
jgi:hypothetical protein